MCGYESDYETEKIDVAAPEGISLLTNRVGKDIDYLKNALVGETIRFNYYGGSEDGLRTVLVTSVGEDSIIGMTLERGGEYRTYNNGKAGLFVYVVQPFVNPPVVDEFADAPVDELLPPAAVDAVHEQSNDELRVRFDEAGEKLLASLSGEQLAELYNKHVAVQGIGTSFDSNTGEVVVKLPKKESKIVGVNGLRGNPVLTFKNKHGVEVRFYLYQFGATYGFHCGNTDFVVHANDSNPLERLAQAFAEAVDKTE